MRFLAIQRIAGILVILSSLTMIPPALVSLWYQDGSMPAFVKGLFIVLGLGLLIWWPARNVHQELRLRDGFLVVVIAWAVVGLSGAVPLLLSDYPAMSTTDAVFEAISALTTTGATVLTGIDFLPPGILFYRQELQWLGGMGIIVLAVAVLPMLRIGGMQLYRAETPGPMKDNKLTPRITETAKTLWYIYLGLTIICGLAYWLGGMTAFDAVSHAFSTVAIGGFSTHDQSLAYFNSPAIEAIAVVFMFLSGVNFALHFLAWRSATTAPYGQDAEFRAYALILLVTAIICTAYLYLSGTYPTAWESLRYGVFQAVSAGTTTGFTTDSFYLWPGTLPLLLIMISFIGGCGGSTAGGMKVIRILLLYKQGTREMKRLIHPSAMIHVKVGGKVMTERVIEAVWGFFVLYVAAFCTMSLVLAATGMDLVTAVSTVAACINNLGPALGQAGAHYAELTAFAKWLLAFMMLLGRLEVFTLLVLFMPMFWRD